MDKEKSRVEFEINLAQDQAIQDDIFWRRENTKRISEEARSRARKKFVQEAHELAAFLNPLFVEAGFEMSEPESRGYSCLGSWKKSWWKGSAHSETVRLEEDYGKSGGRLNFGLILRVNVDRPTYYRADLEHAPGAIRRVNKYIEEKATIKKREEDKRIRLNRVMSKISEQMKSKFSDFFYSENSWCDKDKYYQLKHIGNTLDVIIQFSKNSSIDFCVNLDTEKVFKIQINRGMEIDLAQAFQMVKEIQDAE
jgi:hypothetical protein